MKRPLLIRLLPPTLKAICYHRLYFPPTSRWFPIYENAKLHVAPDVSMPALVKGDVISGSIAFTGIYELDLTRRIAAIARRGGRLLDVGANLGYFSLLWLGLNPSNRCIAVEGSPRNATALRQNIQANSFGNRCQIFECAAGKEPGRLPFFLGPVEQTG